MKYPLKFRWDGEAMHPFSMAIADKEFVIGEIYILDEVSQRSQASHAHFFVTVSDSWTSLPEGMEAEFPSADHMRKKLLIKAGFCDMTNIVFSTHGDAIKAAGALSIADDYSVVNVDGRVMTKYTAKSQSYRAMGKEDFQKSKEVVLELISELLGTKPTPEKAA